MFRLRYVTTIITVGLLGVAVPAMAQPPADKAGVGIGVKAGVVFPNFTGDDAQDALSGKTGWQAGIFFGGSRGAVVSALAEVNVVNKKAGYFGEPTNLYYLDIPVLLRVGGGSRTHGGVNVYGVVGPAFDIKIGDNFGDVANITDAWNGFDIGIVGGVGVEFTRFLVEGRGNWGLRNVNKDLTGVNDIKSRTFAILFGLRFN